MRLCSLNLHPVILIPAKCDLGRLKLVCIIARLQATYVMLPLQSDQDITRRKGISRRRGVDKS